MSSPQSHLRPVPPTGGGDPSNAARQQPRQRAKKGLPTDRVKIDRQYEILAAIGRLSGAPKNPVNADSLARTVGGGIVATTVSLGHAFFTDAGWITNPAKGRYAATDALVAYTRRLVTDTPERAALELHAPVRQSWFWQVLESHSIDGKIRVSDAENLLMDAAEASPGHLPMIRNLITWLEHIGMITVDEQFIAMVNGMPGQAPDPGPAGTPDNPEKPAETGTEVPKPTGHAGERSPATVLAVSFDVKLTVDDLAKLSGEQIKALFDAAGIIAALQGRG